MTPKAREYLVRAEQYEQRAKAIRNHEDREWQLCLARAYRMLAEAEETRSFRPPDKSQSKGG
jgi:predicted anti-sigma-YlaC factor YlaD